MRRQYLSKRNLSKATAQDITFLLELFSTETIFLVITKQCINTNKPGNTAVNNTLKKNEKTTPYYLKKLIIYI